LGTVTFRVRPDGRFASGPLKGTLYFRMCGYRCKENQAPRPPGPPSALYVHVPFCRSKCRYCDFYSRPMDRRLARAYIKAVRRELTRRGGCLARPLASVFIGGGTPTVLGEELLGQLLNPIRTLIDERTEYTVEANPGTVDAGLAEVLRANGVNRVSVGAQSFDPGELWLLGRGHEAHEIAQAVSDLRKAGIENISLDLIYGIPTQTLDSWRRSLSEALALGVGHLSCYALSIEAGTAMEQLHQAGAIQPMEDEMQRECYRTAVEMTTRAGFEHYEISNFARPGRQCRHNLTYWRNESYLGIGPAAASYIEGVRRTNEPNVRRYVESLQWGRLPAASSERLTGRASMAETMMLGLRMLQGIDRQAFTGRFGIDPVAAFPRTLSRYRREGMIAVSRSHVRLTPQALFVADTILADLLAEA